MIDSKYRVAQIVEDKPKIWLISFADLLSLILSFFIMSYATNSLSDKEWSKYSNEITNYVNGKGDRVLFSSEGFDKKMPSKKKGENSASNNLSYTYSVLSNTLNTLINERNRYIVKEKKSGVWLEMDRSLLLKRNKKNESTLEFSKNGQEIIFAMSKIINSIQNQVQISYISGDEIYSLEVSDFITGMFNKSGYEYNIIKLLPENFILDEIPENTIVLLVKPYEVDI